jgi:transposase
VDSSQGHGDQLGFLGGEVEFVAAGVAVTSASVQDRAGGRTVLTQLAKGFRTISLVWADGGYANSVDSTLLSCPSALKIVKRTDDVKGFKVLPRRWVVERTFGWLVRNRRLARDYELHRDIGSDDQDRDDPADARPARRTVTPLEP